MTEWITTVLAIFTLLLTALNGWWTLKNNQTRNAIEAGRTIPEYLAMLQSNSPPATQAIALSLLADRKLISFDQAFDAAYQLDDKYGEGFVGPLIWSFKKGDQTITRPIGYLDATLSGEAPACDSEGICHIKGWEIGADNAKSMVWLDGKLLPGALQFAASPRSDIQDIFAEKPGASLPPGKEFILNLPKDKLIGAPRTLRVRLGNSHSVFTEIFRRPIHLTGDELIVEKRVDS